MAKPKQSPHVHAKKAATGVGVTPRVPGNAGSPGTSNHNPVIATTADYSAEQQQQ
jgi:hypothetical protein